MLTALFTIVIVLIVLAAIFLIHPELRITLFDFVTWLVNKPLSEGEENCRKPKINTRWNPILNFRHRNEAEDLARDRARRQNSAEADLKAWKQCEKKKAVFDSHRVK